jgi:hypothetical protein
MELFESTIGYLKIYVVHDWRLIGYAYIWMPNEKLQTNGL